ncbi:MAG TPA: alpha/beta fold hydrolase [Candidatus Baltobacteraceae bacterium]
MSSGVPAGEAIVLSHRRATETVYVLLHGMTASPLQFINIARALHSGGANVLVPCLPRHGLPDRMTDALADLSTAELTTFARETIERARAHGSRVVVVGFSLGGLLALWIAQHVFVERAVAIAPFMGAVAVPHALGMSVARHALAHKNRFLWWHPLLRERLMPEHGYPRYPTHAVARLYPLVEELLSAAQSVPPCAADILIVSNAGEMAVNNAGARRLARLWRAQPAPVNVRIHRLRGLPPSHDIIEPLRSPALEARVLPKLLELIAQQ